MCLLGSGSCLTTPSPSGHRLLCVTDQVPNAKCRVPSAKCQMPSARRHVPKCQVPGAKCQMPNVKCYVPSAKCPVISWDVLYHPRRPLRSSWFIPTNIDLSMISRDFLCSLRGKVHCTSLRIHMMSAPSLPTGALQTDCKCGPSGAVSSTC